MKLVLTFSPKYYQQVVKFCYKKGIYGKLLDDKEIPVIKCEMLFLDPKDLEEVEKFYNKTKLGKKK